MELLTLLKTWLSAGQWVPTRNFYYERHPCQMQGDVSAPVSVSLDTVLREEKSGKVVRVGLCPHCKTLFYHEDYDEKSL